MTLYRVAQEGFTNIQKHAQASRVQVSLDFDAEKARLSIRDNGCGFDAERRLQQKAGTQERFGLRGIRERIELVGGTFHLESQAGRGTQLSVTVTKTGVATPWEPGTWHPRGPHLPTSPPRATTFPFALSEQR